MFGFRQKQTNHKKTQALGADVSQANNPPPVKTPRPEDGNYERPVWANLDLFVDMNADELKAVGTALERVEYPLGATIIKEGDVGDAMFILESGTVRLDMEHKDFSTKLSGPTSFGEMALITSEPRTATVTAESAIVCFRLKRLPFE